FSSHVRVHAHFDQVQGLAAGSVVSLSGVTVGNVESITFLESKNTLDVKMKINSDFLPRMRQGSQVEIRTQGALGDKFIFIIPGDPRNDVVKEGDILEVARPTDLIGIISERGTETNRIFDILSDLQKITHSMNVDNRMARIMAHLEVATQNLAQTSKDAQRFSSQLDRQDTGLKLQQAIAKLDSVMTKIDKGQGTLGALINDPSVHNQLKALLGGGARKDHVKSLLRTSIEKETD
ncbi:MAG: MlaD family protein, partial [Bdellovibrio sp.]